VNPLALQAQSALSTSGFVNTANLINYVNTWLLFSELVRFESGKCMWHCVSFITEIENI